MRFKYSPYIFKDFDDVSTNSYEFVLVPAEGNSTEKGEDSLIGATISEIFKHFFVNKENVVIYACDNSDGRGTARNRKFNQWFAYFGNFNYIKFDLLLGEDNNDEKIFLSMTLHSRNPFRYKAFEAFNSLQENSK